MKLKLLVLSITLELFLMLALSKLNVLVLCHLGRLRGENDARVFALAISVRIISSLLQYESFNINPVSVTSSRFGRVEVDANRRAGLDLLQK